MRHGFTCLYRRSQQFNGARGCRKVLTEDDRIGVAGDALALHYVGHNVVIKTLGYGCEYFLPNPFIGLELNYPILGICAGIWYACAYRQSALFVTDD